MELSQLRRIFSSLHKLGLMSDDALALVEDLPDDLDLADAGAGDLAAIEDALVEAFDQIVPAGTTDDDLSTEDQQVAELVAAAVEAVRDGVEVQSARVRELVASVRGTTADTDDDDGRQTSQRPSRGGGAARIPASHRPRPRRGSSLDGRAVTAAGQPLNGATDLADAFRDGIRDLTAAGGRGRRRLVRIHREIPDDRRLGDDPHGNAAIIAAAFGADDLGALVASGGRCGPLEARYAVDVIATAARPIRDALPGFGADRGGVTFTRPPTLTTADAGVTVHTVTDDEAGDSKAVWTIECGSTVDVEVQAVVERARIGNLGSRTHEEEWAAALATLTAQHARTAEEELLDAMVTASTAVTAGEVLGASRGVLTAIDRAAATIRARQRLSPRSPLRLIAPTWLRDIMRTDLARQLPGDDTLAVTDAQIAAWLEVRGISATWHLDDVDTFGGTQGAGPLIGWPDTVEVVLYPEGTFLHLDGGVLDLGAEVRDSTLNATNDVEAFSEVFEGVARTGLESLAITIDLCPDGSTAATVDTSAVCTSGS